MGNYNPKLPTKHVGTNKYITFFVSRNRSPTGADYRQPETGTLYSVGTVWQVGKDPTTGVEGDLWMLSKIVSNVAYWVLISSGGGITDSFQVQAVTAPGVNPVVPDGTGLVTVSGGVVANHSVVLETRTRALNAFNLEIQYATSAVATDGTKSGVAHFDSSIFTVDSVGFVSISGSTVGRTITAQSGGALSPTAGNWNIFGLGETVTSGAVSTVSIFSPRTFKYIVDPTLNVGTFQTIAAAVAATSSGDIIFIRPGTYTEDIVFPSSRTLIGSVNQGYSTIIVGKLSDGGNTLTIILNNITLKTNSDYSIEMTGASSTFNLDGCSIRPQGASVSINNAVGTGTINMINCVGNTDGATSSFWTSIGAIVILYSYFDNSGSSTAVSTNSGNTNLSYSKFTQPLGCSGVGAISWLNCVSSTELINAVALQITGTGISMIYNSYILSGSAACVSIGAGASAIVANVECKSSTTNVLTGAGTLFYANIAFTGASSGHNVSTETALTKLG